MVKFDENKFETNMERKIMKKIQIYPSKPHVSFTKMSNQMPKLTKTIMSPLTTMPPKKIMVVQTNRQSFPPSSFHSLPPKNVPTSKVDSIQSNTSYLKTEPLRNSVTAANVEKLKVESVVATTLPVTTKTAYTSGKILLGDVNPYITCNICKGYLIKATTIVECLHTFCHSCLMRHLAREKQCPQCDMSINKSKTNIK